MVLGRLAADGRSVPPWSRVDRSGLGGSSRRSRPTPSGPRRAEHLSKRFGVAITPRPVPGWPTRCSARPGWSVPGRVGRRSARPTTWERAFHSHGVALHRPNERVQPALRQPDRRSGPPAHGGGARRRARLVLVQRCEGGSLRRRLVRGVGSQSAGGRRRRHGGHGPLRPGAGDRRRLRVPPASRPASTDPRSKTSSDRRASRCATSRRASASRRSGAGSPPAPGATTRPTTPTSTTSSSRSGC